MLRRRELTRVHAGVFVEHTGPLSWTQRAWAGVLHTWPAVLFGRSAIRATRGPGHRGGDDDGPIHVAVARDRHLAAASGVALHRVTDLDRRSHWNLSPPRMRVEEAVLDVAAAADDAFTAAAVVGHAVQGRLTTPQRLLVPLRERQRIAHRMLLTGIIEDAAVGACSALERAYLVDVERAHGMRTAQRQVRASIRGPVYRDVEYAGRVVVELDGRLDHSAFRDRDRDLDRDLDAAIDGRVTVRLGWGQVVGRPCRTARAVDRLLRAHGVASHFRSCPRCPTG